MSRGARVVREIGWFQMSNPRSDRPARTSATAPAPDVSDLVFRPVDRDNWTDMKKLFESRGGPKSCWCMVWRANSDEAKHTDGRSRKEAMEGRVTAGVPVGILAYLDGEPIAWCSIAPRDTYRRLGGVDDARERRESVWSVVCFS